MTPRSSRSTPRRWPYKRWSQGPAFVLAAIMLAAGLTAAPASAAVAGLTAAPASAATSNSPRIQDSECHADNTFDHWAGSRKGRFKCGTEIYQLSWVNDGQFPYDGRLEEFGVGGDGIVYHAWERYPDDPVWDGWWPLGGHDVFWGVEQWYSVETGIKVVGGDRLTYCKYYQWWRSDWSYWNQC